MPAPIANRLLPILAGGVLLMLVFVTLKSCTAESDDAVLLTRVPTAPAPDADTPADTIKTLTANVAAMTTEVEALRRDNLTLQKGNQSLITSRSQIEENVATRLRRELLSRSADDANQGRVDSGVLNALTQRMDTLSASVKGLQSRAPANDIPVGLGYDGVGAAGNNPTHWAWIEPLDARAPAAADGGLLDRGAQTANGYLDRTVTQARALAPRAPSADARMQPKPVYTVPRNATLIGSTALTALVGRIPVQGQVRDPMPFKVITGADNLTANGLTVPGVHGMVWSGTAVGDWTLSCVTGRLESVTFVFDDGTIRTLSSDDRQAQGSSNAQERSLGWLSDARGIPCISGQRKTNAAAFLSQRLGVKALGAAADAAAAAQTTAVISNAGSVTGTVSGDVGRYALGKTVAGGSDEITRWLLERQAQNFDAVFVPAGAAVAIHVDRELAIDFDPGGRRLHHARATALTPHSRLD